MSDAPIPIEGTESALIRRVDLCGPAEGIALPPKGRPQGEVIFVEPRWSAYVEASRALFSVFEATAPVVEGPSLEEAFLDVRGLGHIAGSPLGIALRSGGRRAASCMRLPTTARRRDPGLSAWLLPAGGRRGRRRGG